MDSGEYKVINDLGDRLGAMSWAKAAESHFAKGLQSGTPNLMPASRAYDQLLKTAKWR